MVAVTAEMIKEMPNIASQQALKIDREHEMNQSIQSCMPVRERRTFLS